jgi:hypothetical protein
MNTSTAFHLLEKGEACCLCASILIMRVEEKCYISFDGQAWEETESEMIKKEVDD